MNLKTNKKAFKTLKRYILSNTNSYLVRASVFQLVLLAMLKHVQCVPLYNNYDDNAHNYSILWIQNDSLDTYFR